MKAKAHKFSKSKLVISYLRFSSPEQAKGDSQRRQASLADQWCKAHNLTLTDKLNDRGISAFRGKNRNEGALSSFLELVKLGQVPKGSILLVEDLDRISREEPQKAVRLFLEIVESGVTVVTLKDGCEYRPGKLDMGQLLMSVMRFCLAHEESKKKSFRLGESWKAKRANIGNRKLTGRVPQWVKLNPAKDKFTKDRFTTIPEKVQLVRRIFKLAKAGHGLNRIISILNASAADGKHHARSSVLKILRNRSVFGEFQAHKIEHKDGKKKRLPAGDPVQNYFPSIVSESDFYAVQAGLKKRKQQKGPSSKWVNLFSGLLHHVDGSTIRVHDSGYGKRYCSAAALESRKGAGARVMFPVSSFEYALALKLGDRRWENDDDSEATDNILALEGRIDLLNRKIADLSANVMQADDGAGIGAVAALLNKLDEQKRAMVGEVEQLKGEAGNTVKSDLGRLRQLFGFIADVRKNRLTHEQRLELRGFYQRLIKRIDCDFKRTGLNYFAALKIYLTTGEALPFNFPTNRVDRMKRDKLGHPIKSNNSAVPEFNVRIPFNRRER